MKQAALGHEQDLHLVRDVNQQAMTVSISVATYALFGRVELWNSRCDPSTAPQAVARPYSIGMLVRTYGLHLHAFFVAPSLRSEVKFSVVHEFPDADELDPGRTGRSMRLVIFGETVSRRVEWKRRRQKKAMSGSGQA